MNFFKNTSIVRETLLKELSPTPKTMSNNKIDEYAHPEVLVSTDWVDQHLEDPNVRIIESNDNINLYNRGHIPNAVHINWKRDLHDNLINDYIDPNKFAYICSKLGIDKETKCVFYGDKYNWWACYAFWVFYLFGHKKLAIMDGGRGKWLTEGKALTEKIPTFKETDYLAPPQRNDKLARAFYREVLAQCEDKKPIIDVRSPHEFKGKQTNNLLDDDPIEVEVLRPGHIPGALNCHWMRALNMDATFKTYTELKKIYQETLQLKKEERTIVYCNIGERASITWFVLQFLLGYKQIFNYDGSWSDWCSHTEAPTEVETL